LYSGLLLVWREIKRRPEFSAKRTGGDMMADAIIMNSWREVSPEEADRVYSEFIDCKTCRADFAKYFVDAAGGHSHCKVPVFYNGCPHKDELDLPLPPPAKSGKKTAAIVINILVLTVCAFLFFFLGAKYGAPILFR